MCKEGQSLLIDRGKGNVGEVLREQHRRRHFSFFGGNDRLEEIGGVVPLDERTRARGR